MIGTTLFTSFFNMITFLILLLTLKYLCSAHIDLTKKRLIPCILATAVSLILTQLFFNDAVSSVTLLIMYLFTTLILSHRRILDLLLSLLALLLYTAIGVIPVCVTEYMFPSTNKYFQLFELRCSSLGLITDLTMLIILLGIHFIAKKYRYHSKLSLKEILLSLLLPFFSLMICGMLHVSSSGSFILNTIWKISLLLLFFIGYIYYFYTLIDSRIRTNREITSAIQTAYLKTHIDSLQHLQEQEKDIKKMRHDLKNHLSIIQSLCAQGHYEEMHNYIGKINTSYFSSTQPISGNKIADIILYTKQMTAQQNGITFTYEGSLIKLNALSEPDICGLLANAYDNAIDACLTQDHAYIHTKAHSTRNHTYIEIRNSIPGKISIHHNHIKTTKKDSCNHGYGIEIIKLIAQKYHGTCTFSSSDTEFLLQLELVTPAVPIKNPA